MIQFDCPQCDGVGLRLFPLTPPEHAGMVQAGAVYRCPRCQGEIVFEAMRFSEARQRAREAQETRIRVQPAGEDISV